MERIENVMKASGQENTNFAQAAADVRGNVEFMNQINQAYTYVQIPLKMSGQSASGELYVYTNKKALAEGNRELTAFLHLDMEHLGPTDVSVRLLGKKVSTNFYLDNDAAYELLERNYPVLEERLRKKGYDCEISIVNEDKHVNFVEDFLKKDLPSAGQLHRYSFDMRA
jgi:flagellar hook-length control protein FliK